MTPPAAAKDAPIQLRDVHTCFLRAWQKSADADGAHLPELLLAPKSERRWAKDGCRLVRQATRNERQRKFHCAVALIKAARWKGAKVWDQQELNSEQFQLALDWPRGNLQSQIHDLAWLEESPRRLE